MPHSLKNQALGFATALTLIGAASAEVVAQWSFEDDLLDTATGGGSADNLTDETDGIDYVPGVVGKAVAIKKTIGGNNKLSAPNSSDLNLGDAWTLEAFVWRDTDNDPEVEWERFWCKWQGGTEWHWSFRGSSGEFVPDGLDLFANSTPVFDHDSTTLGLPSETWVHVALIGDRASDEIRGFVNGVEVVSTPFVEIAPTAGAMTFGNFGPGNQSGFQFSGSIDEARIHIGAVTEEYLRSRTVLLLDAPPEIVEISYTAGSDTATITWTSVDGRRYGLDSSENLENWSEVDDDIAGGDGFTVYDDESIPLDATNRFYRVRQLP